MSDYILQIGWSAKDGLDPTDTAKIISGADFNTEFAGLTAAVNDRALQNGDSGENFSCNALTINSGTITGKGLIASLGESQKFSKHQFTAMVSETLSGSTKNVELADANVFEINVEGGGNTLGVDFPPLVADAAGMEVTFIIKSDAAGTLAFNTPDFNFPGTGVPAITQSGVDMFRCTCDGTTLFCNVTNNLT